MESKPPADPAQIEFIAEQMSEYRDPDEWVAQKAHIAMVSSFDEFSYPDPEMDAWVVRTHQLMRSRRGRDR